MESALNAKVPRVLVLLVEDEPVIRAVAAIHLEEAGFETVEAANADEAITLLESELEIRIVFTDIDMPGSMDGLKLAASIKGRWPPIKIVITTGGPCSERMRSPHWQRFHPEAVRLRADRRHDAQAGELKRRRPARLG